MQPPPCRTIDRRALMQSAHAWDEENLQQQEPPTSMYAGHRAPLPSAPRTQPNPNYVVNDQDEPVSSTPWPNSRNQRPQLKQTAAVYAPRQTAQKERAPSPTKSMSSVISEDASDPECQPTPQKVDLSELAAAIAQAAKAGQPSIAPRYIQELPQFNGAPAEWLSFKAAFKETASCFSPQENLARLRRSLKGIAKEAVNCLFIGESTAEEVMKMLEARFGRPDALVMAEMAKLRNLPKLTEDPKEVCIFTSKVVNIVATVKALKREHYLHNPEIVKSVIEKMTSTLRFRWYDFAAEQREEEPDLIKLSKFLTRESERCGRFAQPEFITSENRHENRSTKRHGHRSYHTDSKSKQQQQQTTKSPVCTICQGSNHYTGDCSKFKAADVNSRWDLAKQHRLCFRCLRYRTQNHSCKPKPCGVDGCTYSHNKMLHHTPKQITKDTEEQSAKVTSTWAPRPTNALLKVIPVTVSGPTGKVHTYALLDDGSTVTLIDSLVAYNIGAKGPQQPFTIEGVAGHKVDATQSRRVSFTIRGQRDDKEHVISGRTIRRLRISPQTVSHEMIEDCIHLKELKEELVYKEGYPTILIGQDNWHLLVTKDVKSGRRNQPVASRTSLGWVLHGIHEFRAQQRPHRVHHVIAQGENDESIEALIREHFALDSIGVQPKRPHSDPEQKALAILEEKTQQLADGGYSTGLLWKKEDMKVPDNYAATLKRLEGIERKLDKNEELKKRYTAQINNLIDNGYAEVAPSKDSSRKLWYLPHFAVINPAKPGKLRIVHDAAAKTQGVSLNDMLISGPDLLQSLPGILMRYRQRPIAVTADIKDMFLRIQINEEDRDAQRFLWRGDRREGAPQEFRMKSVIFGATSSPCTAIYVKDLNARRYQERFPAAADAIIKNHYMDDYLHSFNNEEEAKKIIAEVDHVHRQANFHLQRWTSNRPSVLAGSIEKNQQDAVLLSSGSNPEKILGLIWKPHEDTLGFNLNLSKVSNELIGGQRVPTKREALRTVMSLYDPLGLATPITIQGKKILQETWRLGIDWDTELTPELATMWTKWLKNLHSLAQITVPRCYPGYSSANSIELHTFVDASETSYTAAVYWRVTVNSEIMVSLVAAKGRVASLSKVTSIPRLELQAAVIGARLMNTVEEEHDIKPVRRILWTDSRTVLSWIRSGPRSYKPFVAHRLAEIEEKTRVKEWRWVPTKDNVADDATRDTPKDFGSHHRWYHGPDFLRLPEESWPKEDSTIVVETTGEERVLTSTHTVERHGEVATSIAEALPDIRRFSNWIRLIRTTARVLQFIQLCRDRQTCATLTRKRTKKQESDPTWKPVAKKPTKITSSKNEQQQNTYKMIEAHQMRTAELLWVKAQQDQSFGNEIKLLQQGKDIPKDSRLRGLALTIDEQGILRLKTRVGATVGISEEQKAPAIIDGNHVYCRLYISWVHVKMHHGGVETVVNELRQQFWILRIRPTVRTVLKQCLPCRIRRALPPEPPTGNHPKSRLAHNQRPFTFTGLDYFGPLSVTVGRQHQKRYVALFTCLTTRAVHLEIAASLSTDSAILALRRFIARRGCPTEIWSDNGTNLRGADAELRRAVKEDLQEEISQRAITWRYIPPSAPFMGGAWERMVRSVKTALNTVLKERHPKEEVLSTLLVEVEHTVNSRPLTHVSTSPEDPEALTPNHFLLGGPSRVPSPGSFTDNDLAGKRQWRQAQRLADMFWSRWIKEYLPLLQNRREPHGRGERIKIDDLVLIADGNLPRNTWPRGRVIRIYPGEDGIVRAVDVRTNRGILRRPTKKLVVLPTTKTDDNSSSP